MANLMDYMAWRGEFGFDKAPWNDVDALIMANLSYLNFHGTDDERGWTLAEAKRLDLVRETLVSAFEDRKAQFEAMAETVRFSGVRMHHFITATDEEAEVQFSATCYDMPDGTLCIGFRGTDGTFVGWREDFNMSYKSPVPAQEAAVAYLEKAAALDSRPIRVTGHSKGGNLAMYAAACCRPEVQDRLTDVYSFDGPGLDPEVFSSEGYGRIAGKIRSFVPQTSIVGLLMSYPEPYTVVCSETSNAIQQHDPMNWQVYGPRFVTRDKVDDSSLMLSETLHEWLNRSKRKDRGRMVDALFDLLDKTRANNFSEIMNDSFRNLLAMAAGTRDMTPEDRKTITKLLRLFLGLGFGNLADRVRLKIPVRKSEGEKKAEDRPAEAETETETETDTETKAEAEEEPERLPEEE